MALVHRVAPWLCGLMDSVLSVKGSQIYRQSAFNKKQVARKVHCRATKGCKYIETVSKHGEMLIVCNARDRVQQRELQGDAKDTRTLKDSSMNDE